MQLKYFIIITMIVICDCQDIVFPNDEEITHLSGNRVALTERIPVYIPKKCPENMLLYPDGGKKSVWICDCRPRFLYFPLNNTCYEAYRQGPCNYGEYVVLPDNEAVPKCAKNPCYEDGLVLHSGVCYHLRMTGGPCAPNGVLGVNEVTFKVECIPIQVAPFIVIDAPMVSTTPCPIGSRMNSLGICRVII